MVYLEYEQAKARYRKAQELYNSVLDEQTELITSFLPSAIKYDSEKVSGGAMSDAFAEYLIRKERLRIDERLKECEDLLAEREKQLAKADEDLRSSNEIMDIIYYKRKLLGYSVKRIAIQIHYSKPQVYRYLERIDEAIDNMRQFENFVGVY